MSVKEQFIQYATSIKTAVITGAATTGTGVGTWFDVIPDDIGKLAALVGVILTSVLIVVHVTKLIFDFKKCKLEIELMRAEAARLQAAEDD